MAAIIAGTINFTDVYFGDLFDVTFEITGIDLTAKTLRSQLRTAYDTEIVLEFKETDGSLTKTVNSTTSTTVQLLKTASLMEIPLGTYQHTIIMYTTDEDVQTIINGTMTIIPQITIL